MIENRRAKSGDADMENKQHVLSEAEMAGLAINPEVARQALRLAAHKLPLATRFTAREHHS